MRIKKQLYHDEVLKCCLVNHCYARIITGESGYSMFYPQKNNKKMKYLAILFCVLWIIFSKFLIVDAATEPEEDVYWNKVATFCANLFSIFADGFCWYWLYKLIGL